MKLFDPRRWVRRVYDSAKILKACENPTRIFGYMYDIVVTSHDYGKKPTTLSFSYSFN
jgi:hypothetical protein